MQEGLLDFIFQKLEVDLLNRKEVIDYLHYLNEIITPNMSASDQVKYLAAKVKLNQRLVDLDKLMLISDFMPGRELLSASSGSAFLLTSAFIPENSPPSP